MLNVFFICIQSFDENITLYKMVHGLNKMFQLFQQRWFVFLKKNRLCYCWHHFALQYRQNLRGYTTHIDDMLVFLFWRLRIINVSYTWCACNLQQTIIPWCTQRWPFFSHFLSIAIANCEANSSVDNDHRSYTKLHTNRIKNTITR